MESRIRHNNIFDAEGPRFVRNRKKNKILKLDEQKREGGTTCKERENMTGSKINPGTLKN